MVFRTGSTVVRRFTFPDGRVASAYAARVVADDGRGVLLYADGRSQAIVGGSFAGESVRHLPYADVLRMPLLPRLTSWYPAGGGALVLTPPDVRYSVLWFFDATGAFSGWYVNLERPARRWWGGMDVHDQQLDVLVAPDRSWQWKDEDEFVALIGHPAGYDAAEAEVIRGAGREMIALAEAGGYPFDGTWCDFRPDPGWAPAAMPWFWDQVRTEAPPPG